MKRKEIEEMEKYTIEQLANFLLIRINFANNNKGVSSDEFFKVAFMSKTALYKTCKALKII